MIKRLLVSGLAGAAMLTLLAGCGSKKAEHAAATPPAEPAAVSGMQFAAVASEAVPQVRELAGSVQAAVVSQVSARIMGQALTVPVAEGDVVKKDQLLASLDDRELRAKVLQAEAGKRQAEAGLQQAAAGRRQAEAGLQQAEAQRELATATHERFRALLEGRAVSRQEYEQVAAQERMARGAVAQAEGAVAQAGAAVAQAESAVAQAASAVEEARTWLAFAEVHAPAAGRVIARRIDAGSMATPGAPLFVIEQEGHLRLELPVDSALSGSVTRGTPLTVSVEAAGFAGTVPVTDVVAAGDPVSRTFLVKADLPLSPGLRSGQYARVTLGLGTRDAITIPAAALVRRGQLDGVFVVETGDRLAYRIVQVGRETSPGRREILSGLSTGERIAVGGVERASDGARVSKAQ
ncbi:MAG: efflux RND transporter periplasmic adaptor subunit [Candidatus Methylomirabilia bacterium]